MGVSLFSGKPIKICAMPMEIFFPAEGKNIPTVGITCLLTAKQAFADCKVGLGNYRTKMYGIAKQ